jgi:2-iminobutanoate/2-iminopropanoate deaminase
MRGALLPTLLLLVACGTTRHLEAEGALGPYSGSVVSGDFVFASGKIGTRGGSFAQELETALDAVEAELARSGVGLGHAVDVTVYLTDMALYPELNDIYARRFPAPYPARTTVGVQSLPGGARVEIDVVARTDP